jgi:hypothetical protein
VLHHTPLRIHPQRKILRLRLPIQPLVHRLRHHEELDAAYRISIGVLHPLRQAVAFEDVPTFDDCDGGLGDRVGFECAGERGCGCGERLEADCADGWTGVVRRGEAGGGVARAGCAGGHGEGRCELETGEMWSVTCIYRVGEQVWFVITTARQTTGDGR